MTLQILLFITEFVIFEKYKLVLHETYILQSWWWFQTSLTKYVWLRCHHFSNICQIISNNQNESYTFLSLTIQWNKVNLSQVSLYAYKLLKKSSETQVWLTISLLLPTHFPCIWYHWKALLFLFIMMCHLLWLRNLGMCSTPEYGGGCKVKCAKMHCYCHTL